MMNIIRAFVPPSGTKASAFTLRATADKQKTKTRTKKTKEQSLKN